MILRKTYEYICIHNEFIESLTRIKLNVIVFFTDNFILIKIYDTQAEKIAYAIRRLKNSKIGSVINIRLAFLLTKRRLKNNCIRV